MGFIMVTCRDIFFFMFGVIFGYILEESLTSYSCSTKSSQSVFGENRKLM